MERESFEDEEVAKVLNDIFVCIKVDREERPDIDAIYMAVCQAMTGSGGWPLTIMMTPNKKPFFSGTYFPKESRYGRVGIMELAKSIGKSWQHKRQDLFDAADNITAHLQQLMAVSPLTGGVTEEVLDKAYEGFVSRFDKNHGGFGNAPKFPTPHNLSFLIRYWRRTGETNALKMVEKTLQQMGQGGIYDQLGLGFHRYSTDGKWLLPHFEKMLYDQAMLAIAYLEAFQATKKEEFAAKAREIFTYVLRDMTSVEGGFYSAEDADSEGEEGKFYVWDVGEFNDVLPKEDAVLAIDVYNVVAGGNFVEEATREKTGNNILHLTSSREELAQKHLLSVKELESRLNSIREKLFNYRKKRIHPYKDDKILTDWNGLMIAAFALGGKVLDEPEYKEAAKKAADFVMSTIRQEDGRLLKRYREGEAALPAHVDDYTFFIWGLIELYEATFEVRYLREALGLNDLLYEYFWDSVHGGLYFTAKDGEALPARPKELYDGAVPSGNSVATLNNLRLARITGQDELEERANKIIQAFAGDIAQHPQAYTQMLSALDFFFGPSLEVVVVGDICSEETKDMLRAINEDFIPNKVVVVKPLKKKENAGDKIAAGEDDVTGLIPYLKDFRDIGGRTTAYVCLDFACQQPTTDIKEIKKALAGRC
ncbi:MAG: thioredoxin domain-containing protein [Clostridia bacterium]|nr:thioredoxin domain-containing protein [Clostridia bacterium]